jgi:hypothetical protein
MSEHSVTENPGLDRLFAWTRYLYWCDLHRQRLDAYDDSTETGRLDRSKWLFVALLAQWYASLWVVVEGWCESKLSDPTIDDLISNCPRFCDLLRRFRNGVYHYQPGLLDPRFLDLLRESDATYVWASLLHGEFLRYLWNWIHRFPEQFHEEFRDCFLGLIGWLPTEAWEERQREAKTLRDKVRRMLSEAGDTSSQAALDLIEAARELEARSQEGADGFARWRREMIGFVKTRGA